MFGPGQMQKPFEVTALKQNFKISYGTTEFSHKKLLLVRGYH